MRGDERVVDLRSEAARALSRLSPSPSRSYCEGEECAEENRFIQNIGQNGYLSDAKLRKIYREKGDIEKAGKEYFIPIGLSDTEKIAALATASLGLVVFSSDQALMDFTQENKTDTTKKIEEFGYYAGRDGLIQLAAGSYLLGAVFKNGKLKQVGLLTVATGIVSQTITEAFKIGVGRVRPRNAGGDPYQFGTDEKSFFSGHVSGAFGTAAVLAEVYKGTAVPYFAYGVAGLVAYARVHEQGHYVSDVVYGALAGYLSAKLTMRYLNGDDRFGGLLITPGVSRDPLTGEHIYNLGLEWRNGAPKKKFSCDEYDQMHQRDKISACMQKLFNEHYDG